MEYLIFLLIALIPLLPLLIDSVLKHLDPMASAAQRVSEAAVATMRSLVTSDGRYTLATALPLIGGSFLLSALSITLAILAAGIYWPAMAPLLGIPQDAGMIDRVAQYSVWAIVICPIITGCIAADLIGWARLSNFSELSRGRGFAFIYAIFVFLLGVLIALAVGALRALVMCADLLSQATFDYYTSVLSAAVVIVIDPLVLLALAPGLTATGLGLWRPLGAISAIAVAIAARIFIMTTVLLRVVLEPTRRCLESLVSLGSRAMGRAGSGFQNFTGGSGG